MEAMPAGNKASRDVERADTGHYLDLVRKAFETANVGITITDTSGRIIYTNPAEARMHGYEVEELLGKPARMLAPRERWNHGGNSWLTSGEALKRESVNIRKDGSVFPVQLTSAIVTDKAGSYIGVVIVSEDITERKEREAELIRLESIAQAVNTMNNIGYVFSGIRHEIGNPINSIKTTLSVLDQNLAGYSRETVKEYIDRVMAELSRVEYILKAMKSFNMDEDVEIKEVDMRAFIQNFESLARRDFEVRGISWKTIIHPEVGNAFLDPRALHQALLNILTNAADACVEQEDPKVVISLLKEDRKTVIRVMDNGHGIAPENLHRIFMPFYTTKKKGTGLGLAIVKKMMARMGCTIDVESCLDAGTIVDIAIP